ncbi:MAG: hypothetical protein GY722_18240 [bacterium]|nr:hypothetical protein [bacterium]
MWRTLPEGARPEFCAMLPVDIEFQDYDGAGHFERVVTEDDFGRHTAARTPTVTWETTDYTATGSTVLESNR